VDAISGSFIRAAVARVHGRVPLDADRVAADPDVGRLPGRPRLHLCPALALRLEPGVAAVDLSGALLRGAVRVVEREDLGLAEGRGRGKAHDLARERVEAHGRGLLRPTLLAALLRRLLAERFFAGRFFFAISSLLGLGAKHTPLAPRTSWPAHGGA
jgi:hypothetical protein